MPQQILALEVEHHEIRAALVEASFRDYKILEFYRVPIDPNTTLDTTLRSLLEKHHLQPHTVVSSLPGDLVTLRTFRLPFKDRKRLDQTVPYELETQVPFDLDEVVVAYQVLSRDKEGSQVLAALVRRDDLQAHLAALQAAGLDPKIVDFAPLASLNVLQLIDRPIGDPVLFLGGDVDRLHVALYHNGHLLGLRTITPAVADLDPATPEGNGHANAVEAVVSEVVTELRWTVLALANGHAESGPLSCLLLGEGIYFDELARQLNEQMGWNIVRIQESPLKGLPAPLRNQIALFAAPLGLALREIQSEQAFGVNFRRGEFAYHRAQEELRRSLLGTVSLATVALGLFVLQTYLDYRYLQSRLNAVNAQIRYVFQQTLPDVQRVVDESRQLREEIAAAEKRLKLLGSVAPPSGATAIDALHAISTAIPETLKLEVDEYVMDTEEIKIRAHTDSLDTPNAIREAIANGKYFADVQVKDIKSGPDGRVDFRMILTLNKAGTPVPSRPAGRS